MKDLGVCILTRSSQDVIVDCLTSLFEQTKNLSMDVVVVDNDSQDDTVEEIRRRFPTVTLILNPDNFGYARAVNQGLAALNARYYVLLNPDAVILDNALERLASFMDENPHAGICIPKVLNSDGTLQYQCRRGEARPGEVFAYFLGLDRLFPNDPRFNGYLLRHLDNDVVNEVKAVSGSCMFIRREVTLQIGGLDELYFAYQEDTDYCLEARAAGWKIYYVPLGQVIHHGGRGGSGASPYFGIYHWHLSYYLYYRKNLAKDYPFWFHPLYYMVMFAKFVVAIIAAFFSRRKIVGTRKPV